RQQNGCGPRLATLRGRAVPDRKEPEMVEPCPLIEVSGPPRERGRQYGKQAEARIRKGIAHYGTQLSALGFDRPAIAGLIDTYLPVMERFEPAYIEEMRGIAEGASLDFTDIV